MRNQLYLTNVCTSVRKRDEYKWKYYQGGGWRDKLTTYGQLKPIMRTREGVAWLAIVQQERKV